MRPIGDWKQVYDRVHCHAVGARMPPSPAPPGRMHACDDAGRNEAVQTSLDRLESVMYEVALTSEGQKEREFQLRHRRPEVYHNMQENLLNASNATTQNNYFLNITLQEKVSYSDGILRAARRRSP